MRDTVPNRESCPKEADYLYLLPTIGTPAPHCLADRAGAGGYVTVPRLDDVGDLIEQP
jgi:hypothetical protein